MGWGAIRVSTARVSEPGNLRDCIQCGLCLESCPTYREAHQEGLSARGRIILMRELTAGGQDPSIARTAERLLDQCLVCRACEAVCPSDVRYGDLITTARATLPRTTTRRHERWVRFALRAVFMHPRLTGLTLRCIKLLVRVGLARVLVATLVPREERDHFRALIAGVRQAGDEETRRLRARLREHRARTATPKRDFTPRDRILIFQGCVTPVLYPSVMKAWKGVLQRMHADFTIPKGQSCCGALHQHHGDLDRARTLARKNIAAFEAAGAGLIVAEAAGCGAALKAYGELLADDPEYAERAARFAARVRDATEILSGLPDLPSVETDHLRVVLQEPCHLRHVQGVAHAGRARLDDLPGVARLTAPEGDLCCGSAGIYNLLEPEMAAALGDRKAGALASAAPDLVITTNPGCRLQLSARLRERGIGILHLLEVCDLLWPDSSRGD